MKDGFIKVAAVSPDLRVADVDYNTEKIIEAALEADSKGAKVIVFPMLAVTGSTCGDLFLNRTLQRAAEDAIKRIAEDTKNTDAVIYVGYPHAKSDMIVNATAVIKGGNIINISMLNRDIPNLTLAGGCGNALTCLRLNDSYDVMRVDSGDTQGNTLNEICNAMITSRDIPGLLMGVEPSCCCSVYPNIVIAPSADYEEVSRESYRRDHMRIKSVEHSCAYIYANASIGESTTDYVFAGRSMIVENGEVLAEAESFTNGIVYADIDVERLNHERMLCNNRPGSNRSEECSGKKCPSKNNSLCTYVKFKNTETKLARVFNNRPFVPTENVYEERLNQILMIQANGLKKRLEHTHSDRMVLGISGGLDSTLALLVCAKACDLAGRKMSDILSVTMPCFGTTSRTYNNACDLTRAVGAELREVVIKDSVKQHFDDIGHDMEDHSVVFENAQARERTQVLMDIANQVNGLVVGTGDLSELSLGWATYNGDHMSMYAVNADVPKTLLRHLVKYYADTCGNEKIKSVLYDVLDTPVSPELLPPKDGVISQKTEDLVGPYELHDFFLYYMLRFGFSPRKIYRMAVAAFEGEYDASTILTWEKNFMRRFFSQQFKRSCLPDGPKVGSVGVSPRGGLHMPSDAVSKLWLDELERD